MREVTCPVYPCGRAIFASPDPVITETFMRAHLRSHSTADFVAGFEVLTAQNTRQLKHLGELNDELHAARKQRDYEAKRSDEILERMSAENARLRQQRHEARVQLNRECVRADRMLAVVDAARGVAELLRLLDAAGFDGSLTGPSRSLVAAMNEYDANPRSTQPRQAPGTDRLTDTEAPVRPCEIRGLPTRSAAGG